MFRIPRKSAGLLTAALAAIATAIPATSAVAGKDLPTSSHVQLMVIPQDTSVTFPLDIVFAGSTGFLTAAVAGPDTYHYYWTDNTSGTSTPVPGLATIYPGDLRPAGADSVGTTRAVGAGAVAGDASVLDLATMSWTHYAVPSAYQAGALYSNRVVAADANGALWILAFSSHSNYSLMGVTGLPATFQGWPVATGHAMDMLLRSRASAGGEAVLDLATGVASVIPMPAGFGSYLDLLTPTQVGLYNWTRQQVLVYSLAGLVSGAETRHQTVSLPATTAAIALVPGAVLAGSNELSGPVRAFPDSGGAATTVLSSGDGAALAPAPDGSVLEAGAPAPGGWGVQRIKGDANGGASSSQVVGLNGPLRNAGLTFNHGLLRHIESIPLTPLTQSGSYQVFNHVLVPDTSAADQSSLAAFVPSGALPCAVGVQCVRIGDGGLGGASVLLRSRSGIVVRYAAGNDVVLPSADGRIVDTSPSSQIVDGTNPARQYLIAPSQNHPVARIFAVAGAGLWYSTLWRGDGPGKLVEYLRPHVELSPVTVGGVCTATDVQVSARWVYWSCGQAGPAGLYNKRTGAKLRVPAGPSLLGDGYLVQARPASPHTVNLVLYDFHAGALRSPATLATIPAGPTADSRNITWAVDKYSGDIAYVDAADAVHVMNPGVPTTPVTNELPKSQTYWLRVFGPRNTMIGTIEPSRPVLRWAVQIRYINGPAIYQTSGGPARMTITVPWNGLIQDGLKAYSGSYAWIARATVAGSPTSIKLGRGIVNAYCGRIPFRSEDCDGEPALLAIHKPIKGFTGLEAFWYQGSLHGLLRAAPAHGFGGYWPMCGRQSGGDCINDFVPFGDFNGDGYGDMLVKYGNGMLRVFLGYGSADFYGVKSMLVGRGWRYNMLAAPGDLTSDGWPDLLARDNLGRMWLYRGTGHGRFMRRKLIGGGWGRYLRLVGAGNLTGTGAAAETGPGDLLAVSRSGIMWMFKGNGHGGFTRPARVSGGWSRYNAIIGIGDLNHDGRNDFVARDTHGRLWFFAGNGSGGFARGKVVARNWNRWRAIF